MRDYATGYQVVVRGGVWLPSFDYPPRVAHAGVAYAEAGAEEGALLLRDGVDAPIRGSEPSGESGQRRNVRGRALSVVGFPPAPASDGLAYL